MNLKNYSFTKKCLTLFQTVIVCFAFSNSYLSFAQYPAGSPVAVNGKLKVSGTKMVNSCGNTVQLRGMSSHGIQWFDQCYTASSLDAMVNDWKIDVFRLAMYVQEGGYVNNPTYWKGWIDNMVNECGKRGIYCIIDWHVLTPGDPMANINEAREFWTYMSSKHAGKNHVLYEICNEPNGVDWARVKTYADDIIPRIRANDPSTIVIVGTPTWSQDVDIAASNKLNYSNIMYTLHFYSGTHTDGLRSKANTAISRGIALFVTEFGTSQSSGNGGPYLAEGDKWMSWMAANNISWVNWSFADKAESSAALLPGACGGNYNNTSTSGTWVKQKLVSPADNFVCNGTATNPAPTVSITSPSIGASFNAPASITINASASDANGSVTKVEFFNGSTRIGEDLTSPYSYTWSNVPAGNYTITAKATDNGSATATSSGISLTVKSTSTTNRAPGVSISSPVTGAKFTAPASVTINASASDPDGSISKVEFFNGSTKLGEDLSSPYTYIWSNVAAGNYSITAKATDNAGASANSSIVSVSVQSPTSTNQSPKVNITAPFSGANFAAGSAITINASASDPDGTITKVEFYRGSVKIGEDASSPYSIRWTNAASGSYQLTAKAIDNKAAATLSSIVYITVGKVTDPPVTDPAACQTSANPVASQFVVRNSWSDQYNGSAVSNTTEALQITHRSGGLENLWVVQTGKSFAVKKGITYTISLDFKNNAANPVNALSIGLASGIQWDGPSLIQTEVAAPSGFPADVYSKKTITITAATDASVFLSLKLGWQNRPTQMVNTYIKNISICTGTSSSTAFRVASEESAYNISSNPFMTSTSIRINEVEDLPMYVSVEDFTGKSLLESSDYSTNETFSVGEELDPGIYILKCTYGQKSQTIKLIKE